MNFLFRLNNYLYNLTFLITHVCGLNATMCKLHINFITFDVEFFNSIKCVLDIFRFYTDWFLKNQINFCFV